MNGIRTSRRTRSLRHSEIRNMTLECARVSGINLSQGVCDTPVPELVRRAAQAAIDEGFNIYTRYDGLSELRRAIARNLQSTHGLGYDPESQIVVTNGATGAFYGACSALLDPGDEVILFEPFYGYHADTLLALEAVPKTVTLKPPSWSFESTDLDAAVSPRTRAIVVNTPANPSGKVFDREELERIAVFAVRHNLAVITDEIYDHFVYDARRHTSPASLPALRERTISIGGFSKTFSITGWRVGFSACASDDLARILGHLNDLAYVCAPAPLQMGVARGLELMGPEFYELIRSEYTLKRDKLCEALSRARLEPYVPQGSYYILADAALLPGTTSKERALALLERLGIASVPGSAFYLGSSGDTLLRFCFAKTDAELDEACRRLERLA
ncbi:MAG TPA: pyridoxal phosphate-dependent aminotransferase [Polyangiaceae bacterium]|nr:pyridoxal phosphate-dependent aminotransferase [Polyangiaceae bacterium]